MKFVVAALIVFGSLSARALGGTETHGGDGVVAEFFDIANEISRLTEQTPSEWLPDGETFKSQLTDVLAVVKVETQEKVFFQGREVQAINIRTGADLKIVISRSIWKYSIQDQNFYYRLVLHELLPLMGLSDLDYSRSSQLMDVFSLIRSRTINQTFVHHAFRSEDMAKKVLTWMSRSPLMPSEQPADLVLEITLFGRSVSHVLYWNHSLSQMANLILKKMTRKERAQSSQLECALKVANDHSMDWYYQVDNDLRDLFPSPQCTEAKGTL